jgi:hypothetical protein
MASSSNDSIISLSPLLGREINPNDSVYLSHSAYFVNIEEIKAFAVLLFSFESL